MKKIYIFCIVALIALFGLRIAKPEGDMQQSSGFTSGLNKSVHDEITEISKTLPDSYKPWLLSDQDFNINFSEADAHIGAITTGFSAGILTKVLGAGGGWPFVIAPVAWYVSLKLLYIFTPTGRYCTAHKIVHKVLAEMSHDIKAHGSFNSLDDVMTYTFTHFGDDQYPLLKAQAYFKSLHDRLLRAKIFLLQAMDRAEAGSELAIAADKLEKSINKTLELLQTKMGLIISAAEYLEQHRSFHQDAADRKHMAQDAHERDRDRQAALAHGTVGYQRIVK